MNIELHTIPIGEIIKGYVDNNDEEGVYGYDGKLSIRPKYQREFVYKEKEEKAVIDTVFKNFPLNVMYWAVNSNGNYEVIDGQQRTISICRYAQGDFSINLNGIPKFYHNLTDTERERFLNYKLMVYFCEGTQEEKLDWFRIINIAGVKLTEQELRNASYTGPWLSDAKSKFSKTGCIAYRISNDYVSGIPNRQELLEKALDWISNGDIENYMAIHQNDDNCNELWSYFQNVIDWVSRVFIVKRAEMKNVPWGNLYDKYHENIYDANEIEKKVSELMADDDVTKKSGVYSYVLSGTEQYLNIRAFTKTMKRSAYERQNGYCPICGEHYEFEEMEGDHIFPWSEGGKTTSDNCQMLCRDCNRKKGNSF